MYIHYKYIYIYYIYIYIYIYFLKYLKQRLTFTLEDLFKKV